MRGRGGGGRKRREGRRGGGRNGGRRSEGRAERVGEGEEGGRVVEKDAKDRALRFGKGRGFPESSVGRWEKTREEGQRRRQEGERREGR